MFLNILKKDLKRKKAMNIIVLLFIVLATMFVASSVNNIVNVTTALDDYYEMANMPDYFLTTANKTLTVDIDETLSSASAVDSYQVEETLELTSENLIWEDEKIESDSGGSWVQSDISLNYFLSDESILKTVNPGEFYMTESKANTMGVEVGDKLTIEVNGLSRELVLADKIKDALTGGSGISVCRYIVSEEDFEYFLSAENTEESYGGSLVYIYSSDMDTALEQIKSLVDSSTLKADSSLLKSLYIFDMIVVGVLLVVGAILIIIAFVVLRFTITFTLSEEFREIGVMKAIGISNFGIRTLYLVKYLGLSVIGAAIGTVLSFPFGEMLMNVSSKSIIMGNQNTVLTNILCAILVIAVILLFSYRCTGKVKSMTPIDAIRNSQTGERFRKKSLMSLGKSKLPGTPFLALNDIVSSPKRYSIVGFTIFLCLTLMLLLSITVFTMKNGGLSKTFGFADCDVYLDSKMGKECMTEDGREKLEKHLDEMEQILVENDIPAKCYQEMLFNLPVSLGENESTILVFQGVGTTMDMYEYTAGTAPQYTDEIAITRLAADMLNADIGDTVTIKTLDGDKEYIITAFFQAMGSNQGVALRLHSDEYINYNQSTGSMDTQIMFTDNPDKKEMESRIEEIQRIFPEYENIESCAERVADMLAVTDTFAMVKSIMVILTVVIAALVTVLIERSFIAKEQGEIALMKAIGTKNGTIYAYHALRFLFVGIIAVILGAIFALPITQLCMNPIFKMMGMEIGVNFSINPIEMFLTFPGIILATITLSAFFTALYTRKIKSSDTANIE